MNYPETNNEEVLQDRGSSRERGCSQNREYSRNGGCCGIPHCVFCFLILVFAVALGLILGAVFFETILPVLASLIAFAAAVLVVIIAMLVYRSCRRSE